MRRRYIRSLALLSALVLVLVLVTAQTVSRGVATKATNDNISDPCSELLTVADFIRTCPSAAAQEGLRVRVDAVALSTLSKCSVSVTARGAYTFHIFANVFRDAASALARFHDRTNNVVDGLAIPPGNELGFGEASALHHAFGGPELDFQREHVYVEISPSGGFLCSDGDLRTLGRLLYERVSRFEPYAG